MRLKVWDACGVILGYLHCVLIILLPRVDPEYHAMSAERRKGDLGGLLESCKRLCGRPQLAVAS
jgi:hypothetical protein